MLHNPRCPRLQSGEDVTRLAQSVRTVAREKGYRIEERSYGEFWVHTPDGVIWYKRDGRIAQAWGTAMGLAAVLQNEACRRAGC